MLGADARISGGLKNCEEDGQENGTQSIEGVTNGFRLPGQGGGDHDLDEMGESAEDESQKESERSSQGGGAGQS